MMRTTRSRTPTWKSPAAGFTLVEVLVALTIFGVIVTGALQFMSVQNRGFRSGLERIVALQAAQHSLQTLELDLQTLGTNLAPGQPALVFAGESVIAFSADYATNVADDPFAAFYDPDAPSGQVITPTSPVMIPGTALSHPDTTYLMGGGISPAELILFYFTPDTTTERTDDYALFRQVNQADPTLVARGLRAPTGAPFFRYIRHTGGLVDSIPDADLPLFHSVPIHLSAADTGSAAVIDSVRAVRVSLRASNGRAGEAERIAELTRIVRFPNAGLGVVQSCGSKPLLGVTLSAALGATPSGDPAVDLSWQPAIDEAGGEGDIIRYVIWRREEPAASWEDPYLSIPAGNPTYSYNDASIESGRTYRYALAGQDCTPTLSDLDESINVTIP